MAFNILVVDDSSPMRAVIRKTIDISGFDIGECYDAVNGLDALDILRNHWIDLVVTDYNMPEMNGLELIENMKEDELLSAIPVLVVTTEGSREMVKKFYSRGAKDYIQKPFTPEDIRRKLNDILGVPGDGKSNDERGDDNLDF